MARAVARLAFALFAGATAKPSAGDNSLLQTWDATLEGGSNGNLDTPVTRVVNLLKEMAKTLAAEMKEDEDLYHKLACWCNNNEYEKGNAIEASTGKIAELQSSIESMTAKKSELASTIKELEAELAANKQSLAEATAIREKQLAAFHKEETDSIQAVEQLKAAIIVLQRHHTAPPESAVGGGPIFKTEKDSWSLISVKSHDDPWNLAGRDRSLDDFMRHNGFDDAGDVSAAPARHAQKFLQQGGAAIAAETDTSSTEWSLADTAVVQKAVKAASAFVQAHHAEGYYPAYASQSGEILGVLQQLKDEMESNLSDAQKQELERASSFAELRSAKTSEIESGEKMAEQKEDELANTANALADARVDLEKEGNSLTADQRFMKNLRETCSEADKNFETRKSARMQEMTAVSEAIEILQEDKARDAMSGTFSFVQLRSQRSQHETKRRAAAATLRQVAKKFRDPALSVLATSVELDAFTRVKKAIDDMVAILKQQQADEVKKSDWCKAEFHENEVVTARTTDQKANLEATIADLESNIKSLEDGITDARNQIAQVQLELQRATEDRKAENRDFQKTIADQSTTVEVLRKALDKLATFYNLAQIGSSSEQTPPVPQMEYKKSKGASGVIQLLEKLIHDAQDLMADSRHSESQAQAAYEQLIADSNNSVEALQKAVVAKTRAHVKANKDKMQAHSDLSDTTKELEGLAKYNADLQGECNYILKNFDVRQSARSEEIEALQQAKQILSGASLN